MSEPKKIQIEASLKPARASVKVEAKPDTRTVTLYNKLRQKLNLNVVDATGKITGIELNGLEKRGWTFKGPTLGPDFDAKKRKGFVCLV